MRKSTRMSTSVKQQAEDIREEVPIRKQHERSSTHEAAGRKPKQKMMAAVQETVHIFRGSVLA